ncbi:hypothetical protein [Massilia phosphatilytica]
MGLTLFSDCSARCGSRLTWAVGAVDSACLAAGSSLRGFSVWSGASAGFCNSCGTLVPRSTSSNSPAWPANSSRALRPSQGPVPTTEQLAPKPLITTPPDSTVTRVVC